jgi:uncharacterized protein
MTIQGRLWMLAAAAALSAAAAATAAAQNVEAGAKAWQQGRYDEAVRQWRGLADRGDVDAQYNLAHAYRLGRGVPQNMNLAEQWYERAARGGHEEAQAMYGVILFQNGRRQEAMPYIQRGAEQGDPRAQYVLGTALFNGDLVPQDWPRAYALMTRASEQGLAPATSHLREMEQHISEQDRARGVELAREMASSAPTRLAEAEPPEMIERPRRVAGTQVPPSQPPQPRTRPDQQAARPIPAPAATGRWKVQLGAFSSEANARRAWEGVRGRLAGLQPSYVRAGAMTRLQAGPLPNRAAADRACATVRSGGGACFPVAP